MRLATKEEQECIQKHINNISTPTGVNFWDDYKKPYKLNLDKVTSLDDCKKILKFLCDLTIEPIPKGYTYVGFDKVKEYFN